MDKDRILWTKCKAKVKYADDWVCGYYVNLDGYDFVVTKCPVFVPVTNYTVCFSTGYKDKNGRTIYENDIVSYKYTDHITGELSNRLSVVRFNKGTINFNHNSICAVFEQMNHFYSNFEVIGHISSSRQQDMLEEQYLKYLNGNLEFDNLCEKLKLESAEYLKCEGLYD